VVGIAGDRAAGLALARSLIIQAATHHGPADLTIGVFVDPGRDSDWDWSKWLPHTRNATAGGGARWLSDRRESSDALLRALAAGAGNGTTLVVLDSDVLTEGTNAPARSLLQRQPQQTTSFDRREVVPVAGIVLAPTTDRLPAACTTVIEVVGEDGDGAVLRPEEGGSVKDVLLAGVSTETARRCARDLARFEDPELALVGAGLPEGARLLPLLGLDRIEPDSVRKRWRHNGSAPRIAAPLGVSEEGVFVLDLERDGPHGLVAGTTGAGKSELLRSLVAGLAAQTDPTHLTFVLIDYKGGAAFDECSRLPHTVGMVTDLDEQLGERALQALEAELHHRERVLRAARADNLRDYLAGGATEPLPRLVVVIDEFATMAAELPNFISSLVGIAQRGRTLGVHLILATQRPSGAVNDNIRANTNLRIALRVQDAADSADVIGSRDAAEISRSRPGRAFVRLGPEETVAIQTALVTCVTDEAEDAAVDVAPFRFGPTVRDTNGDASSGEMSSRSDLARLVDAIIQANEAEGVPPPRRPWPEPLPDSIDLAQILSREGSPATALVALADDPSRQQQYPVGWDLSQGNILLFGIPGSGVTSTLAGLALSLASKMSPDRLEIYALDYGVGELKALEELPHTGSVIVANDRERQMRFVRHLRRELARRRDVGGKHIRTVVFIDNFSAMRAEFTDVVGLELMDQLTRVFADGPEVGISFALAADRVHAVPGPLAALSPQKWLFRLAESSDYSTVGLTMRHVPRATPGRAVMVETKQQIQVGRPSPSIPAAVAEVAARYPIGSRRAAAIGVLPARVSLEELCEVARLDREPVLIPIGRRESDLAPALLSLYEGEHIAVAGPARSGQSPAFWTIPESVKHGRPST
jgi:S-DNA-T family DNA segregation ATPase FtsK/SpoIIIE